MTDETHLIAAMKQGDQTALAAVFERYSHKIYRLALRILHDEQQADGVVQDTFLKLIHHINTFEGRSGIGTWLYRVAYNEASGRMRSARPQVDMDTLEDDALMPACLVDWQTLPEHALKSQEALNQMEHALAALSPSLRAVFELRDVEELSIRETAEILDISESAVKVRLHRARLALREYLAAYFEEYVTA